MFGKREKRDPVREAAHRLIYEAMRHEGLESGYRLTLTADRVTLHGVPQGDFTIQIMRTLNP